MLRVQKPGKGAAVPGDVPAPLCCAANECRLWLCFSLFVFFFPSSISAQGVLALLGCRQCFFAT